MNPTSESKKLAIELKEKEEDYVSGVLDLNATLDKTDHYFDQVAGVESVTANEMMHDSYLMKLQTNYAKRSAKAYKPDSLVFKASEFAKKLKLHYYESSGSQDDSQSQQSQRGGGDILWLQLGNFAKKWLYTVPSFSFIHGTFSPDPEEVIKKKRKMKVKDKVGKATKPESVNVRDNSKNKDMTIDEAERVLSVLARVLKKNDVKAICFYEFVTDPTSFGRTVENIFTLSILVKEGCVRIIKDGNCLPCLTLVPEEERSERNPAGQKQTIITIGHEEWRDIVETFKLENPVIPPRKSAVQR